VISASKVDVRAGQSAAAAEVSCFSPAAAGLGSAVQVSTPSLLAVDGSFGSTVFESGNDIDDFSLNSKGIVSSILKEQETPSNVCFTNDSVFCFDV
jgi:hypothetical protein